MCIRDSWSGGGPKPCDPPHVAAAPRAAGAAHAAGSRSAAPDRDTQPPGTSRRIWQRRFPMGPLPRKPRCKKARGSPG
eukprot:16409522-Heterocapsa_arctica.AAC.1